MAILFPLCWRRAGLKLTEEGTSSSSRCSKTPINTLSLDPNLTKYQPGLTDVAVCLSVTGVAQPRGLHGSKILDPIKQVSVQKPTETVHACITFQGKTHRIQKELPTMAAA